MNDLDIHDQILTNRGYKKNLNVGISFPYAECFYQKRFRDDRGIKYFIEIVYYAGIHSGKPSYMCHLNN